MLEIRRFRAVLKRLKLQRFVFLTISSSTFYFCATFDRAILLCSVAQDELLNRLRGKDVTRFFTTYLALIKALQLR